MATPAATLGPPLDPTAKPFSPASTGAGVYSSSAPLNHAFFLLMLAAAYQQPLQPDTAQTSPPSFMTRGRERRFMCRGGGPAPLPQRKIEQIEQVVRNPHSPLARAFSEQATQSTREEFPCPKSQPPSANELVEKAEQIVAMPAYEGEKLKSIHELTGGLSKFAEQYSGMGKPQRILSLDNGLERFQKALSFIENHFLNRLEKERNALTIAAQHFTVIQLVDNKTL